MDYDTVYLNRKAIRKSRNLRGVRDYARVSPVCIVDTQRDPKNKVRGLLRVQYENGAVCTASFADYAIMIDFVRTRRSWRDGGAIFQYKDEDFGYLTKPGVIAGV